MNNTFAICTCCVFVKVLACNLISTRFPTRVFAKSSLKLELSQCAPLQQQQWHSLLLKLDTKTLKCKNITLGKQAVGSSSDHPPMMSRGRCCLKLGQRVWIYFMTRLVSGAGSLDGFIADFQLPRLSSRLPDIHLIRSFKLLQEPFKGLFFSDHLVYSKLTQH